MIDTTTNKIVYNGDGSTREWNLTVPTTSGGTANLPAQNYTTDIELYVSNKTTEELTKITSNYEINATTHKVIYPTVESGLDVLTTNQQLIILRATPITQEKDHNARFFKSVDVEQIADKLTMVTQDLKEIVDRAVCVPITATTEDKIDAKELIQEIKDLKETVAEISGDIPDITEELESKMPLAGGTFTGDVTLNSGVSLKTQNGRIHEVNNKVVIGDKSSDKGLYVSPNGETAALVGNTVKNILTNNDVTSTYSPSGVSPVNGQAVASAINTKQDTLVSGNNIKTVNNQSLLGSGNINVDVGDGYLPKVFDGTQTLTPKTAGSNQKIRLDANNNTKQIDFARTSGGFEILAKKYNDGTFTSKATISADVDTFKKIEIVSGPDNGYRSAVNVGTSSGIEIQQQGTGGISTSTLLVKAGQAAKFNGNDILTAADKGVNNGVASLGSDGKVPSAQLPNIDTLPSQTGNAGKFLTTDGTNPSWADVLPSFPAPSETVNEVSYTAAGGTSQILNKEIQSITFNAQDTSLFNPAIFSGPEEMSFYIGRTSAYVPADDVLLTFNFSISNNVVSYAELVATRNGSSLGSIAFITDLGNGPQFTPWDSSFQLGNGINIYWDSTNKRIVSDLNFKPASLTALSDAVDNVFVFETVTETNSLPAASSYANKLAYVYETGTYSDIKNLIYSNGTSWQFLPGTVLEIPDERMHDTVQKVVPAYCGIPLASGQLAIPARNKSDAAQTNYSAGQMHEFYSDSSNWLNRYWSPMNFGTIFSGTYQYLGQSSAEESQQLWPQTYSYTIFKNEGYTTHTQRVIVYLGNMANFCYAVFAQGTNKIQLEFDSATNAKVFLNGQEVNTSNNVVLDADSKTYIANFYDYSDSSGYVVMDVKELPYSSSAHTQVVDLGSISTTTALSTNANYTATISGSAAFTLPTPSDTSIENTINLLLTVSATTTVDWGVNANSVLTSFSAGKYELRLRYNNSTSNWIGEVLKAEATPSHNKTYVSFNGNYTDQTNNITLTPSYTITSANYVSGENETAFAGVSALKCEQNGYFTLSDPNEALKFTGTFTVKFWGRTISTRVLKLFAGGTCELSVEGTGAAYLTGIGLGGNGYLGSTDGNPRPIGSMHYIEITRDSNNTIYYFVDGVMYRTTNNASGTVDFSNSTSCLLSQSNTNYYQDLVITDQVGHTANYDVPTAPYVLTDNSLADYHDDTKQDILTSITGYDASKTQILKNVQGVLTWVDEA